MNDYIKSVRTRISNKTFHTVEEITHWNPFELDSVRHDLSHLDAHLVIYTEKRENGPSIIYKFIVTYGLHCFTKDEGDLDESMCRQLLYHAPKESRPFNWERYRLSFHLPKMISSLGSKEVLCFHAGYSQYATYRIDDEKGNKIDYQAVFKVFKEKKKLRLHVTSAYPLIDGLGKIKKINFFVIAHNLLHGKPLPKEPLK